MPPARSLGSYSTKQFRICLRYKLLLSVYDSISNVRYDRREGGGREREREGEGGRESTPAACWLMILEMENSPRSSMLWKLSSSSAPTDRISASGTILGDSMVTPSAEVVKGRFVTNATLFRYKVNDYTYWLHRAMNVKYY